MSLLFNILIILFLADYPPSNQSIASYFAVDTYNPYDKKVITSIQFCNKKINIFNFIKDIANSTNKYKSTTEIQQNILMELNISVSFLILY